MPSAVFFYRAFACGRSHLTNRCVYFHKFSAQLLELAELRNLALRLFDRVPSQTFRIGFPIGFVSQSPMWTMSGVRLIQAAAICLAALLPDRRY